jgi:hypothetical protein
VVTIGKIRMVVKLTRDFLGDSCESTRGTTRKKVAKHACLINKRGIPASQEVVSDLSDVFTYIAIRSQHFGLYRPNETRLSVVDQSNITPRSLRLCRLHTLEFINFMLHVKRGKFVHGMPDLRHEQLRDAVLNVRVICLDTATSAQDFCRKVVAPLPKTIEYLHGHTSPPVNGHLPEFRRIRPHALVQGHSAQADCHLSSELSERGLLQLMMSADTSSASRSAVDLVQSRTSSGLTR